jgi:hypothetical protein
MVALWIPDRNTSDELWLTTIAGTTPPLTMAQALMAAAGQHIGFSNDHFFQIAVPCESVETVFDNLLARLLALASPSPILPMKIEAGAILVHPAGAPWALAVSRQHRQRLRRDGGIVLGDSLTSVHVRAPLGMWSLNLLFQRPFHCYSPH